MKQSHFICENANYDEQLLLTQIQELFEQNNLCIYDDQFVQDHTTFYDNAGLMLLVKGGHCKVMVADNKSKNSTDIILELRRGKHNATQRFTADNLNFTVEEMAKVFGFNRDLIPVLDCNSELHHFLMKHKSPSSSFNNFTPHFDFVPQMLTVSNPKLGTSAQVLIFSLVDKTDLIYNSFIARSFDEDVDQVFEEYNKFMKQHKFKKMSNHRYGELMTLTQKAAEDQK